MRWRLSPTAVPENQARPSSFGVTHFHRVSAQAVRGDGRTRGVSSTSWLIILHRCYSRVGTGKEVSSVAIQRKADFWSDLDGCAP